jgi:ABC-type nickel/cobalt efflux system permease component RcnA
VKQITLHVDKSLQKSVKYKLYGEKPINGLPQNRGILIFFNGFKKKIAPASSLSGIRLKEREKDDMYSSGKTTKTPIKKKNKQYENSYFYRFLSSKKITFFGFLFMLIAAFFLGAAHALSPGHGKSLAAAFFIGQNATIYQALAFALSITFSHVISVIVLGMLAFFLQNFFVPETIGFYIQITSGILVIGIGISLFVSRFKKAKEQFGLHHHHGHTHSHLSHHGHSHSHSEHSHHHDFPPLNREDLLFSPDDFIDGDRESAISDHELEHAKEHLAGLNLDKGASPTMRQILGLGISGGIVPCPTAIVILLVAIAFNRLVTGLLLIVFFSLGLAAVLFTINMLVIKLGNRFLKLSPDKKIYKWASVVSAAIVTIVGIAILIAGLVNAGFL